ncbi:hypothetical protein [Teredinibacter haidensis]|uniref:hypothetical protein n=1 Tax=Teredinibacter haidensis TaxID=2731755 RepID=UPI000948B257|nr:hypothetical protein [Teredinibacter haidensis]
MTVSIELTNETYTRLEKFAVGFDSPESVIIRLMDSAEGKSDKKPELVFSPSDENEFKRELIKSKVAEVVIYKAGDSREVTHWNANRFNQDSNLRGNLWSGILRDWKTKGITKVELTVLPRGLNSPDDNTEEIKALALEFQLTYDEMSQLDYDIDTNASDDGLIYTYIVQFVEGCNPEILDKIDGLHEHLWVNVDRSVLDLDTDY